MNKKFTLTLIIAVALVSVIAFSACGFTAVAEGTGDAWASSDKKYPYPNESTTSPGFSGYTAASDMILEEGETLTPITEEIASDPWRLYQTMRENQGKVRGYAQVTNTLSNIGIKLTTDLVPIFITAGKDTFSDPIAQYASWMTANDGDGNSYSQTISQMDRLLPNMDGIAKNFGVWEKSATIDGKNYSQAGNPGTRSFGNEYPAGVSAQWKGDPTVSEGGGVTYDTSAFDYNTRIKANKTTDTYKVFTGDAEELGNYRDSKKNEKNASNWDEEGNRVIFVQFKGSDGSWGYDTWLVWDDLEGKTDGSYVGFDHDRWFTALPNRGDSISNYLVNEETFDDTSSVTKETVDGHTYYVLDVKLQATDNYSWDLITSGEFASLQGGIIDFLGFSKVDSVFSDDLTLRYEIWDTGVIRRAIKIYTVESAEGAEESYDRQIAITALNKNNPTFAYGHATNNQIQEYAYGGDVLDISGSSMYTFGKGALDKWVAVGIGVGVGAAVLIVLIVTLVVLAKKGVIGKKKNKKATAEGPAEADVAEDGSGEENKE